MLEYTRGNLLDASAEALVNTVNEVGVMGKGIALMFKERFPEPSQQYVRASKAGGVRVGTMFVTATEELFPKWIIHFPTKRHWRHPSKVEWIQSGLQDLVKVVRELGISSIAVPPLGCGNGGLDWQDVRPLIEEAFASISGIEATIYEPTVEYQNKPKRIGVEELTPARALVAEIVRRYAALALDCTLLEVHKLAFFLQKAVVRSGLEDPLDLRFSANRYGPYADRLRHLLNALDGSYLHSTKRISDASPLDRIWFDNEKEESVRQFLEGPASDYAAALAETTDLIDGFESPLGLELLATVDWLVAEIGVDPTPRAILEGLGTWPGGSGSAERKLELFDERLVVLAVNRLRDQWESAAFHVDQGA